MPSSLTSAPQGTCRRRAMQTPFVARWCAAAALLCPSLAAAATGPDPLRPEAPYPLDGVERTVPARGRFRCPEVAKVRYGGTHLRYQSAVTVAEAFAPHLAAFEAIVVQVAVKHYGRPPRLVRHIGTHNCRRIGGWPTLISEHGLANGIDIAGFDFGPAPRAVRPQLVRALHGSQQVRVVRHWRSERPADATHRAFLHDLGRALVAARHVFRVVLGPGYPGHEDHLHLDCSPWRLVDIELDAAAS